MGSPAVAGAAGAAEVRVNVAMSDSLLGCCGPTGLSNWPPIYDRQEFLARKKWPKTTRDFSCA